MQRAVFAEGLAEDHRWADDLRRIGANKVDILAEENFSVGAGCFQRLDLFGESGDRGDGLCINGNRALGVDQVQVGGCPSCVADGDAVGVVDAGECCQAGNDLFLNRGSHGSRREGVGDVRIGDGNDAIKIDVLVA